MAIYRFKCSCSIIEVIMPMKTATFEDRKCPKCEGAAKHVLESPPIATSGMYNSSLDVAVGRDAEARWSDIKRRQEIRKKVRQSSGKDALTMTGRNEFQGNDKSRRFVSTPDPVDD